MHTYAYIGMHPIHTYAHIPTQYTLSGGAGAQKFKSLSVSTLPIKCDGDGKNKYCSDDGVEEDEQDCDDNENDSVAMHYRLRGSIGFLNVQKVSKSRLC